MPSNKTSVAIRHKNLQNPGTFSEVTQIHIFSYFIFEHFIRTFLTKPLQVKFMLFKRQIKCHLRVHTIIYMYIFLYTMTLEFFSLNKITICLRDYRRGDFQSPFVNLELQ